MIRTCCFCLLALLGLCSWTSPGRAQVYVQTPFVTVSVGPPWYPGTTAVTVRVPSLAPRLAYRPAPIAVPVEPARFVAPLPAVASAASEQPAASPGELPAPRPVAVTLCEFADSFQPTAGCHEVLLVNPVTGCPCLVQFKLPAGCPNVYVLRREVAFDYGNCLVRIRFRIGGRPVVIYSY